MKSVLCVPYVPSPKKYALPPVARPPSLNYEKWDSLKPEEKITSIKVVLGWASTQNPDYALWHSTLCYANVVACDLAGGLAGVPHVDDPKKPITIYVDRNFLKECDSIYTLYSVLFHEMLHVLLMHVTLRPSRKLNFAADVLVNAILDTNNYSLPTNTVGNGIGSYVIDEKSGSIDFHYGDLTIKDVLSRSVAEIASKIKEVPDVPITSASEVKGETPQEKTETLRRVATKISHATRVRCATNSIGNVAKGSDLSLVPVYAPCPVTLLNLLKRFAHLTSSHYTLDWSRTYRHAPPNLCLPHPLPSRQKVLAFVDTSGSMSTELLEKIFGVLAVACKTVKMKVYTCDADVYEPVELNSPKDAEVLAKKAKGGGGTNFTPAFELAERVNARKVVFFTDGYAILPKSTNVRVLWVVPPDGYKKLPFGETYVLTQW